MLQPHGAWGPGKLQKEQQPGDLLSLKLITARSEQLHTDADSNRLCIKIFPMLRIKSSLLLAHMLNSFPDDLLDLKLVAADHFDSLLKL